MVKTATLDVVVFGASGFTGALVCEYLAKQYGTTIKWAMAGRNQSKLEQVRKDVGMGEEIPIIIADSTDEASLRTMAEATKCVLTTTGPYQLYGSALVGVCAALGTDYVDLSGEPAWMHEMIATHNAAARASGARIVHSCGFDSVPFDLGVLFTQNAAQKKWGAPAPRIYGRVRAMNGEFSGGTAASMGATMQAVAKNPDLLTILADPFSLAEGFVGPTQPADNKPYEDKVIGQWVAPFIMAPINTKNVHRSNALLGHLYGKDFCYDEMMITGVGEEGKAVAEFVASHNPLAGDDVPKPGEGPSREAREAGNYDVLFVAQNAAGETLHAGVTGDKDPGYGSTSKMITESALCLIEDCPDLAGGIYTPAAAQGVKLIPRLVAKAGLTFEIEN